MIILWVFVRYDRNNLFRYSRVYYRLGRIDANLFDFVMLRNLEMAIFIRNLFANDYFMRFHWNNLFRYNIVVLLLLQKCLHRFIFL